MLTPVSVDRWDCLGDNHSGNPTVSSDGRYVAFESVVTNMIFGDTNDCADVFVRDIEAGKTTRVSVDSLGAQGNGPSYVAEISSNGQYVAFESDASNLVSGDTNGLRDVFLHDMGTGATTRLSVSTAGVEGNAPSADPAISDSGWLVAYHSGSRNLVSGDTNGLDDVFVYAETPEEMSTVLPAGWSMMSLPLDPDPNSYASVFGDDFDLGDCALYRWDPTVPRYVLLTGSDALSNLRGYWFLSPGGTLVAEGYTRLSPTEVPLAAGWNLISAPWESALADVQVRHEGEQLLLGAAEQTWVMSTLYRWDNGNSRYVGCSPAGGSYLTHWSGYWALAQTPCSLIIPATPPSGPTQAGGPAEVSARPDWAFELEAACAGAGVGDTVTVAGSSEAGAGFDGLALDQPKAPTPPLGGVRMVIEGPATSGPAAAWTSELQQETRGWGSAEGATYRVDVSGPSGATVTLRWPDLSGLPSDASAWLVNPATGTRTYLRTQQSATVRLSEGAGQGSAELEVQVRPKVAGTALVSALSASAAGSGSTEVAFTLGAEAWVTVRVLNVAGRPIATVVADRAYGTGPQSVVWTQRSAAGTKVPAGRYLCEVQARTEDGQSVQQTVPLQVGR